MKYQYHLAFRWALFSAVVLAIFFGIWSIFAPVPALIETHYNIQYGQSFMTNISYWWLVLTIPLMVAMMIDLFYPWKTKGEWASTGSNVGFLVALVLICLNVAGFIDFYVNTIFEDITRAIYLCIIIYAISIIFTRVQFGKSTFYFLSSALLTIALSSVIYVIIRSVHGSIKYISWEAAKYMATEPQHSVEHISRFNIMFLWFILVILCVFIVVIVYNKMRDWGLIDWLMAKNKKPIDEAG